VKINPQLATRLGSKKGGDKWNDIGDATASAQVKWRQASADRMNAQFDRARLSPEARVNYDIWALEADRAALSEANRRYRPPLYSRLYSAHSQLPDFLVNTHNVADAADLTNYIGRLRGIPAVLDVAIARSKASAAAGIRAPKFQIETIISGSESLTSGAPFGAGPDAALWADVKSKTEALVTADKLPRAEADAMLAEARAAILGLKPAYDRVIAWAKSELPTAPSAKSAPSPCPAALPIMPMNSSSTPPQTSPPTRSTASAARKSRASRPNRMRWRNPPASRTAAPFTPTAPPVSRRGPMTMPPARHI